MAAEHTTLKYSFGVICKLLNVAGKKHFFYKWSSDGDKEFFISYQLKRAGTLMVLLRPGGTITVAWLVIRSETVWLIGAI